MGSLEKLIRKKITLRIVISLLMSFILFVWLSVYNISRNIKLLELNIERTCKNLEDFVIGQTLVPNNDAIKLQIDQTNKSNSYYLEWVNKPFGKIKSHNLFLHYGTSWSYYYPLRTISNNQFGYFLVKGSLINEPELYLEIIPYLLILLMFYILISSLLMPLASSIPNKLFIIPINTLLNTLRNPENHKSVDVSHHDSIELEEISKKIISLVDAVEKNSKEAAIGKMASEIAHNINSPLQALFGLIKKESFKQSISIDEYNTLLKQITEIKKSINEILTQRKARTRRNELSTASYCNVLDLIESTIQQKHLEWIQSFDIELILNINSIIWIKTLEYEFRSIISNLLNNAYESINTPNKNIQIKVENTGEIIRLQIIDNGIGIPSSEITNVKNGKSLKSDGNGIGLPSAVKYVDKLGGILTLQSEENIGTIVTIELPKKTIPNWCASEFILPRNKQIVILDNDKSSILFWQKQLLLNPITPKFFVNSTDFMNWYKINSSDNILVIADYTIDTINSKNNIELLENMGIKTAYIITQYANESWLQSKIENTGFLLFAPRIIWPLKK